MIRASAGARASSAPAVDDGPWTITILTATPGSPSAADVALHNMLEGHGHTVGYHSHTNATLPGGTEIVIFSSNNDFTGTFNMWTLTTPTLDLAPNSIYVRGLLPWDDDSITRFDPVTYFGRVIRYTVLGVIDWAGQAATGSVTVYTADIWSNPPPTRAAINRQTDNDAQHFLRFIGDGDDSGAAGFFLPQGSTVTEPNDVAANEVQRVSTAPYIGLFFGWGAGAPQFDNLNAAGDNLYLACLHKLMNP